MANNDYLSPEEERDTDRYNRPNYETAEEYNKAMGTGSSRTYTSTSESSYESSYSNPEQNRSTYNYNTTQYANLGGQMVDENGNPIPNYFAVQLVFAIVEIVCCCCMNIVTMVLGIIALVFAIQANNAYKQGQAVDFKSKSKVANILLIIGGIWMAIAIVFTVITSAFVLDNVSDDIWDELEYEIQEEFDNYEEYDDEYYSEYLGDGDVPLADGFHTFTHKGVAYTLPMDFSEFETMGYTIDEENRDDEIDAMECEYIFFYNEDEYLVGEIIVYNYTEDDLTIDECVIGGISFYNDAAYYDDGSVENVDVTFCGGLDMDATYEDIENFMGTPTYIYCSPDMEDPEYASYSWYYYGDDDVCQRFDVVFWDGVISELSIEVSGY